MVDIRRVDHRHPINMQHASGVVLNLLGPATDDPGPNILQDVEVKHPGIAHFALRVGSLDALRVFLDERTDAPRTDPEENPSAYAEHP